MTLTKAIKNIIYFTTCETKDQLSIINTILYVTANIIKDAAENQHIRNKIISQMKDQIDPY